jgi:hypothetical protein
MLAPHGKNKKTNKNENTSNVGSIEDADATEPRMLAPHTRHDAVAEV